MKNLLLTFILLASSSVFAKNIAHYRFAIGGGDWRSAPDVKVISATLTDAGILMVEKTGSNDPQPEVFEEELNEHNFTSMKWNVIALANAEIETIFTRIVCAMMPSPGQSNNHLSVRREYDSSTQDFLGQMKLISSPQGCWVAERVRPVGSRQQLAANILREQIKTAALEMIKR